MAEELRLQSSTLTKMTLTMPILRYFPIFSNAFQKFNRIISEQFKFFDKQINNQILKRKKQKSDIFENFVDAFLNEQEQRIKLEESFFRLFFLSCTNIYRQTFADRLFCLKYKDFLHFFNSLDYKSANFNSELCRDPQM